MSARSVAWANARAAARAVPVMAVVAVLLAGALPSTHLVHAQAQPACRFVLGFATLRTLVGPEIVGDCLEDERFNPTNGNAEQPTTGGLLVWRQADNWTAFTDGHWTWINGPFGVQRRLNGERFAWEQDPLAAAEPEAEPSAIEVSDVATGWGPSDEAALVFPYVRFTITNRTEATIPLTDRRLLFSAEFLDPINHESYGSGLGVVTGVGLEGLRPAFSDEITIQGTGGFNRNDESQPLPNLTVELYQRELSPGDRRLLSTYQVPPPPG
jgi:hypothetical protein